MDTHLRGHAADNSLTSRSTSSAVQDGHDWRDPGQRLSGTYSSNLPILRASSARGVADAWRLLRTGRPWPCHGLFVPNPEQVARDVANIGVRRACSRDGPPRGRNTAARTARAICRTMASASRRPLQPTLLRRCPARPDPGSATASRPSLEGYPVLRPARLSPARESAPCRPALFRARQTCSRGAPSRAAGGSWCARHGGDHVAHRGRIAVVVDADDDAPARRARRRARGLLVVRTSSVTNV